METTVLDLVGSERISLDLDVNIPASKEEEFERIYNSKRWNGDEKGSDLILYPPTMKLGAAKRFCKKLPEYAKVSNASVYYEGHRFFSGPFNLSVDGVASFVEGFLGYCEKEISDFEHRLEKVEKEVREEEMKRGIPVPIFNKDEWKKILESVKRNS